jgi:hypothetical protein
VKIALPSLKRPPTEWHTRTLACRKHKTLGCSPKEASYSSYIVNNPSINFLAFDALPKKHYLAVTSHGTYALSSGLSDKRRAALVAERILSDKQSDDQLSLLPPTFSDMGQVRDITLIHGNYSAGSVWFHPSYSTHYVPVYGNGDKSFKIDNYLTYIYRLNGRTEERLEPVSKVEKRPDVIEEWLYLHWQEEKKKSESVESWEIKSQKLIARCRRPAHFRRLVSRDPAAVFRIERLDSFDAGS